MKIGYEAGKGKTFTPSTNANWTDEFNQMLNNGNLSRNALTEKLIEDGLKYNKQEHILLEASGLSPRQAEILNSEAGQEILKNVLRLLLGESSEVLASVAATSVPSYQAEPIQNTSKIDPPKEQTLEENSAVKKKPKALDKLRNKMQNINEAKTEL